MRVRVSRKRLFYICLNQCLVPASRRLAVAILCRKCTCILVLGPILFKPWCSTSSMPCATAIKASLRGINKAIITSCMHLWIRLIARWRTVLMSPIFIISWRRWIWLDAGFTKIHHFRSHAICNIRTAHGHLIFQICSHHLLYYLCSWLNLVCYFYACLIAR